MKNSVVYSITSPSGSKYIGSTSNFPKRKKEHINLLLRGAHHSQALQRACDKYRIENLKFKKIIICSKENLFLYEQIAIDYYPSKYNAVKKAGSFYGKYHPYARKVRCIETGEIFDTMTSAAEWLRSIGNQWAGQSSISQAVRSKSGIAYGYTWERV